MHISSFFGPITENVSCPVKVTKIVFLKHYFNVVVEYNISAMLLPLLQENIFNLIHEKHIFKRSKSLEFIVAHESKKLYMKTK